VNQEELEASNEIRMPDVVGLPFSRRFDSLGTNLIQERSNEWYPPIWFSRFNEALEDLYRSDGDNRSTAIDLLTFDGKYITAVAGQFDVKEVVDDTLPAEYVIEQEPAPGVPLTQETRVILTVGAGRPAVAFDRLPAPAKRMIGEPSGRSDDLYLMVNTPYGIAYKSDDLLFGPCVAVGAAYRTLSDSRYDDKCYDSSGRVSLGQVRVIDSLMDLTGLQYEDAQDMLTSDEFFPYRISADRISTEWIANNEVPAGIVVSQRPDAGSPLLVEHPIQLEVSAGGPAVGFDDLPDEFVAWLATIPLATVPFVLDFEPILVVQTSDGIAYKTDQHLFGPCGAVRAAWGTFEDEHYDTITPNPCSRLGDIDAQL
jgi:hypothetical protein